jgi:1-aminocyclopropane-1-carboxylate deaminase/D-cysteine desulfhydrase-like pyridoxal-dependent ACC family enzyme
MPVGGATPVGALAYVHAADELLAQMPEPPDWIVIADGSGGTHAGLLAGLPASVRVLGVDVSRPPVPLSVIVPKLAAKTAALAGRAAPGGEVIIADHCGPHYASITEEAREAVRLAARTEGLVLDPVYTGKAMAGLIAGAKDGRVSGTVVFWHTGGAVALFADDFASF